MKNFFLVFCFLTSAQSGFANNFSWQTQFGYGYFHKIDQAEEMASTEILSSQFFADLKLQNSFLFKSDSELSVLIQPELLWIFESSYLPEKKQKTAIWNLYESYAKYTNEDFKIVLGKSIISWGSSDILNPVDFFGAKDSTLISAQTEKNRKGIISARSFLNMNLASNLDIQTEAIIAPSKIQTTPLNLENQDWGAAVSRLDDVEQSATISLGLKSGLVTDQWDFFLFLYSGQAKNSEEQILKISPTSIQIGSVHQNSNAFGIDNSFVFNKWIFRSEAAYQKYQLVLGQENLKSPDLYEFVIGVERPLGNHINIQGQFYQRKQTNYPASNLNTANPIDVLTLALQTYNDQRNGFISNTEYGWTLRLNSLFFDDRLELQNSVMTFQESSGYFFRNTIKWSGIDNLNLSAGFIYYTADEGSPLGQLKKMSHAFTEVTYTF